MNYTDAIEAIENEIINLSATDLTNIITALAIFSNENSEQEDKLGALDLLDSLYWNCNNILDRLKFGQSIFTISFTVDPSRPCPIRHGGS